MRAQTIKVGAFVPIFNTTDKWKLASANSESIFIETHNPKYPSEIHRKHLPVSCLVHFNLKLDTRR